MKSLIPFFLTVLVCSCSATVPPKKEPVKAPVSVEQEYKSAQALAESGSTKKALVRLKQIVQQYPESDLADDAHFLMGNIYYVNQAYEQALAHYLALAKSGIASPLEAAANIGAAKSYIKMSRPKEATEVLEKSSYWNGMTTELEFEIEKIRYDAFTSLNQHLDALKALVVLAEKHPLPIERDKYRIMAQEILESKLTPDELEDVADSRSFGSLQIPAKYRYALMMADQRRFSTARSLLVDVAKAVPGSDLGEKARTLVDQIDARSRVDYKTIGVILPLSGKQAAIGYKALRGIQLGLGVYGSSPSQFRLAVIDSEGNPDVARRGVEKLVTEDNVIAIIGGLLSRTVTAEAAKAQEFGVPSIMLSQKSGVTQAGESIFRNSLTSQMQVQYLVDLAMGQLGYKNFAIMFPNDAYGVEYSNLFWDEVKSRGGQITGAQSYDPKEADFRGHVQRLVGLYYLEDREDEHRLRLKAWKEKNPKRSSRQAAPSIEEILPPIVDFDAIFIPDSSRAVGQIAPMLAYNNIKNVRLLGTNLWNSTSLVQRGQRFVEDAIFVDSYLSNDPAYQSSAFVRNFKATFNEEPGLTEMQAYDSALVLRQLVASGETTRVGLQKEMSRLREFPGALGVLGVTPDREIRRPLSALTIKNGKITAFGEPRK